jgi:hypothetical protein
MALPPGLHALQDELLARNPAQPSPLLRGRLLSAVRRELGRESSRRMVRGGFWSFAAATAAAALLWANFSMSAVNSTDWSFAAHGDSAKIRETAERIRGLLPEMSDGDALRHALLLHAGSRLIMTPDPRRPAVDNHPMEIEEDW